MISLQRSNKERFKKVLEPIHRTFWKRVYKKSLRKISSLRAVLQKGRMIMVYCLKLQMTKLGKCIYLPMERNVDTVILFLR